MLDGCSINLQTLKIRLYLTLCIASLISGTLPARAQDLKLWYTKPSQKWTDALPIGNGHIGAMIYGDALNERLQFNESTLWTGGPREYQRNSAVKYLPQIRQLLFDGKQKEAEALAGKEFMGLRSNEKNYSADSAAWLKKVQNLTTPSAENFDDSKWAEIPLPQRNGWETVDGFEGLDGAVWLRISFELPADMVGKNMVLNIGRIRDMDHTYVNGKLIGAVNGVDNRKYPIPASVLHAGRNVIAIQVINFWDKGGFTGSKEGVLSVYPEGGDPLKGIALKPNWKYWVQDDNPPAYPRYNADYQPFADLYLQQADQGSISNYKRDLDISNATAHVFYTQNGIDFTREYLASNPDKVIGVHLTASQPGKINFAAFMKSLHRGYVTKKIDEHTLAIYLKVHNGVLRGVGYLYAKATGGAIDIDDQQIKITNADEATLYFLAATNFKNYHDVSGDPEAICKGVINVVDKKAFDAVRSAHISDYQYYFNTFSIDFGETADNPLPTDERIAKFHEASDPALISLFMQYGRYLLISSSRAGGQPANLQGLWNDLLTPPWGSKFTTNINLEMNYWPAEELNLSALNQPLWDMIDDLSQTGKLTAREHYGAPGWVLHHNTDLWRGTAPVNASNHGIWVSGAAWLCHHLWEHYLFTHDEAFLRNEAYPQIKAVAEFFVHNLVKDPKPGYLISTPSNSPEHGGLVAGPTMDHQIIRDVFKNFISASEILNTDPTLRNTVKTKYARIAPNRIGSLGDLQEWMEDKEDTTEHHRHVSHLWGVYPGTDITWDKPEMMKAARQSLLYRGDAATGWSVAWKINLWARFKDGDHALRVLDLMLSPADAVPNHDKGGVYHNLFDAHPPFQIDGNFGGAAGIAEMLLQSQMGKIELLPALPSALPNGEVKGLCARGGFVVNFNWKDGAPEHIEITSAAGQPCTVRFKDKQIHFATVKGHTYRLDSSLKLL